jgi:hemolysin III
VRKLLAIPKRGQSQREEISNSISHGVGLVAALVGTPFLIMHALRNGDAGFIVGASLFSASMILLYLASTLYHAWPRGKAKRCFRVIEHSAIFLLIAGTYTPLTLGSTPWRIRLDAFRGYLGSCHSRGSAEGIL